MNALNLKNVQMTPSVDLNDYIKWIEAFTNKPRTEIEAAMFKMYIYPESSPGFISINDKPETWLELTNNEFLIRHYVNTMYIIE